MWKPVGGRRPRSAGSRSPDEGDVHQPDWSPVSVGFVSSQPGTRPRRGSTRTGRASGGAARRSASRGRPPFELDGPLRRVRVDPDGGDPRVLHDPIVPRAESAWTFPDWPSRPGRLCSPPDVPRRRPPVQALRHRRRPRRPRVRGPAGPGVRLPRRERRRQDDDDADHPRRPRGGRGPGELAGTDTRHCRARRGATCRRSAACTRR